MNVVLLGPPGAGKGTLARALADRYDLSLFNTGDELRRVARRDTERGRRLRATLADGNMASTELVMALLVERLGEGEDDWVLDGIPRNPDQVAAFLDQRDRGALSVAGVCVLEAPSSVLVERLLGRSTCEACGTIYHDQTRPPPAEGRCDPSCGGRLTRREDDHPEGIARRLELYRERTEPAIEALADAGVAVVRLDACVSRAGVRQQAVAAIEAWRRDEAPPDPLPRPSTAR